MSFIKEDIKKILNNTKYDNLEKLEGIMELVYDKISDVESENYEFGKDEGYDEGYSNSKKEIFDNNVDHPKKLVKTLMEDVFGNDNILMNEFYQELKYVMKAKGVE